MSKNEEYGVIKRIKESMNEEKEIIERTVQNGNLVLHNVPFAQRKHGELGADGESEYFTGETMYKMAGIFEHMIKGKLKEFDYRNYRFIEKGNVQ